jgi:hypothetical protein
VTKSFLCKVCKSKNISIKLENFLDSSSFGGYIDFESKKIIKRVAQIKFTFITLFISIQIPNYFFDFSHKDPKKDPLQVPHHPKM